MTPKITLISQSDYPDNDTGVCWVLAQESPAVQVLILQGAEDSISHLLAQALPHVKGELFCWLAPGCEFQHPEWLSALYDVWRNADVDLLGVRGMAEISLHTLQAQQGHEAVQLSRVIGGARIRTNGTQDVSVESVMALGPGMLMGKVETLRPWVDGMGSLLRSDNVITFSLQSRLFAGLRLGVAQNFPLFERNPPLGWATYEQLKSVAGFLPLNQQGFDIWHRNLHALQTVHPELLTWLAEESISSRWARFDARGNGRMLLRGGDMDAIVADVFINATPGDTWWMLGSGTGKAINEALAIHDTCLHVLEPEAALLCHLLSRYDWSNALRQRRLRLHVWDVKHPLWKQLSARQLLAGFQGELEESHRPVYFTTGGSYYLNEASLKDIERGLHRMWMRLRDCMQWKNLRKEVFDVTVVSPQCAIFKDLAECFHRMGYNTRLLNVSDGSVPLTWQKDSQHALNLLHHGSTLTLFRNRSLLESDTWQEPMPISPGDRDHWVSWWWDVPNVASLIEQNIPSQATPALGFAKAMLNSLPAGSQWLPPAARSQFCMQEPAPEECRYEVSFVGQSRWNLVRTQLAILRALVPDYLPSGKTVCESWRWEGSAISLHQQLELDAPLMQYVIDRLAESSPSKAYYLDYVWRMALSGAFRMASVELLIREGVPVAVFGDGEWLVSGIVPEKHFAGIVQTSELANVYRQSRINLNLNFMQVSSTVNPKVLDVSACNGVVLTDYRNELDELFPYPDQRPASFTSLEELPDTVHRLLDSDTRQRGMQCGEWVRSRHTMQHRAAWLADHYRLRNRM